ncbi:hypothetical protein Tco_0323337 [Tanacetum coccineum]
MAKPKSELPLEEKYYFQETLSELIKKASLVDKVVMFSAETEDIAAAGCCANIIPNQYKEYLAEFWYSTKALENFKVFFSIPTGRIFGEVGVNTFRNAIGTHYLPHSSEYVSPPSIDVVRQRFPMIRYEEEVSAKGTLRKSLLPPSLANGINIDYANIFREDIIIKLKKKQWEKALKSNQPKEPSFTDHMLAICAADKPVVFKASKTSSKAESVSQDTKPGAQTGHKKPLNSSKQPSVSSKEATKDTGMHKEDQQATGGPTSLWVTGEARANPQLNSGNDASAASIAEADSGNSAPSTDPHVLADQTKSVSEGLETILTQPITRKGANSVASQIKEETSSTIKLEDHAKLVSCVHPSFKDLDSPEDDPVIVMNDSNEDEDYEVYAAKNVETKDTLVPKSSSPRSSQVQELTNQVLILQSQKYKLELEKNQAEAALLKAQPSFPNVEQLKELLDLPSKFKDLTKEVKGLKNQVHYLEIELPGDLKEIPLKLEDFTKIVTNLTSQVVELKILQWELPAEFLAVPSQVKMVQAKLKTLDALPSLLNKVTNALNQFAQAITSKKTRGDSVPSAGQAGTQPAKGEKNTNQATIS